MKMYTDPNYGHQVLARTEKGNPAEAGFLILRTSLFAKYNSLVQGCVATQYASTLIVLFRIESTSLRHCQPLMGVKTPGTEDGTSR